MIYQLLIGSCKTSLLQPILIEGTLFKENKTKRQPNSILEKAPMKQAAIYSGW
jgi:hypothetical protein